MVVHKPGHYIICTTPESIASAQHSRICMIVECTSKQDGIFNHSLFLNLKCSHDSVQFGRACNKPLCQRVTIYVYDM